MQTVASREMSVLKCGFLLPWAHPRPQLTHQGDTNGGERDRGFQAVSQPRRSMAGSCTEWLWCGDRGGCQAEDGALLGHRHCLLRNSTMLPVVGRQTRAGCPDGLVTFPM